MAKSVVEVQGLSKSYLVGNVGQSPLFSFFWGRRGTHAPNPSQAVPHQIWALRDLSFHVEPGEMLGVIGRNGAGKSTLLRILARITTPTSGVAMLRGRVSSLLEVGTGFHQDLTGRENIYLNGTIMGMRRREIGRKFDAIVGFSGVEEFLDTPVKYYSSGMYLRLAFAVAAHLEPEILLVDEVLAVGDYAFQQRCLDETEHISRAGRSIIFVSHNLPAVARLCPKTMLLDQGRVVTIGRTSEVIQAYIARGIEQRCEFSKEPSPKSPLSLVAARVLGEDGRCREEISYQESITIEIDTFQSEPLEGTSVAIGIGSADRTPVMVSADFDRRPERLALRPAGYYRSRVVIPGEWLNPGRFLVMVYLSNVDRGTLYEKTEALSFTVNDTGSPSSYIGLIQRKGVLQPYLEWRVEALEKSSALAG